MTASKNIQKLREEIDSYISSLQHIRSKIIELSNATDWLGTDKEREWLYKAEASMDEAMVKMVNTADAMENLRSIWAQKEGRK
jgi:hypothetical protein